MTDEQQHTDEGFKGKATRLPRVNNVHTTLFEQQGKNGPFDKAVFQKRYEKDGEAHFTPSFSQSDLQDLSEAARQAFDTMQQRAQERGQGQSR